MKFLVLAAAVLSVVCWVASQIDNYEKLVMSAGKICQKRTNGSNSDSELIAHHKPLTTNTQYDLLHCIYQRYRMFCGDSLNHVAFTAWAFCLAHDGNATKFVNFTEKIQSGYDAAKALNDTDGPKAALAMYNYFSQQ